jgi:hypothetical protein
MHNFFRGKVAQYFGLFVIFKKLPKENIHSRGENFHHLVTLLLLSAVCRG